MSEATIAFAEMMRLSRTGLEMTLAQYGAALGVSAQHIHDIEHGRRLPSVALTNSVCEFMGRGALGRADWHRAGARAHGWEIDSSVRERTP